MLENKLLLSLWVWDCACWVLTFVDESDGEGGDFSAKETIWGAEAAWWDGLPMSWEVLMKAVAENILVGKKEKNMSTGRVPSSRLRKVVDTKGLNWGGSFFFSFSHSTLKLTQILQSSIPMTSLEISKYIEKEIDEMTTGFRYWIKTLIYSKEKSNLSKGEVAGVKYEVFDPPYTVLKLDCLNISTC